MPIRFFSREAKRFQSSSHCQNHPATINKSWYPYWRLLGLAILVTLGLLSYFRFQNWDNSKEQFLFLGVIVFVIMWDLYFFWKTINRPLFRIPLGKIQTVTQSGNTISIRFLDAEGNENEQIVHLKPKELSEVLPALEEARKEQQF